MSYKSLFTFTGIILCAVLSLGAHAQVSTKAEPYFTSHEMPDMLNWYSSPPKEDSEEFIRDIKRYYWGKSQRLNPERAAIAVRDARYGCFCNKVTKKGVKCKRSLTILRFLWQKTCIPEIIFVSLHLILENIN